MANHKRIKKVRKETEAQRLAKLQRKKASLKEEKIQKQEEKVVPVATNGDESEQDESEQEEQNEQEVDTTNNTSDNDESDEDEQQDDEKEQGSKKDNKDDDDYFDVNELEDMVRQFDDPSSVPEPEKIVIKYTKEELPENDEDLIVVDEHSKKHKAPPMTFFIHIVNGFIKMTFFFHKVPEQFIRFDAEADHFVVDSLDASKKLYLKRKYPNLVQVDPHQAKAEIKANGILTVFLPITHMPQKLYDKESKIIQEKRAARTIKFDPPPMKKVAMEAEIKSQKKSEAKKRRRETEAYFSSGQDIKSVRKKQKTK
ncbi:hypothetical protein AKO1_000609 [Acrasis kona]|uniref:SHSP domain-containing protein n=1 Tax=Acrasis kona TaxID=1008807 RepID=A0AAW2ZPI7_9EUKA